MEEKGIGAVAAIVIICVIAAVAAGGYYLLAGPKEELKPELSVEASADSTTGTAHFR